jgi:hypothetical protein
MKTHLSLGLGLICIFILTPQAGGEGTEGSLPIPLELAGIHLGLPGDSLELYPRWEAMGPAEGSVFDSGVRGELLFIRDGAKGMSADSLVICGVVLGRVYKVGVMSDNIDCAQLVRSFMARHGEPERPSDGPEGWCVWEDSTTALEVIPTPGGCHVMLTERTLLLRAYTQPEGP